MPVSTTDQALVFAARNGNDACFEELYKRYYDKIYALARTTVKNDSDAQDVLQATFVKAWQNLGSLGDPAAFNTWLGRIALNECYTLLRRQKPAVSIDEQGEEGEVMQLESDLMLPAEYAERGDLSARLGKIIGELSEVQRETVVLFYYEEMTVEEIAAVMDCSPGTVKSRLFLARKALKTEIEEQERRRGEKFYGLALPFGGIFARQIKSTMLPPDQAMRVYAEISRSLSGSLAGGAANAASASSPAASAAPVRTAGTRIASAAAQNAVKGAAGGAAKAAASGAGTVAKALWLKITAGVVAGAIAVSSGAYGVSRAVNLIGENAFPSYSAEESAVSQQENSQSESSAENGGELTPPENRELTAVDPETLPESLKDFLNQFLFGYLDSNDGKEYDCNSPDWRLILRIATNGACVDLSNPSGTVTSVFEQEFDPLGKYTEKGYITFREENVLWIAENLFHTGKARATQLLDYALENSLYLYEYTENGEKRLCNRFFGVGGPAYVIRFESVKTDGERYYLTYTRTIDGSEDDAEHYYAEVSAITYGGTDYWTLWRNAAQAPAEFRVPLPSGYKAAYRAYLGALEERYDAIFRTEVFNRSGLTALCDVYGDETPELIFWESKDGDYDVPQRLTVLTYENGGIKTIYQEIPGEFIYRFALYRREGEKKLWLYDSMPVADSGHTILSSFEEENGALTQKTRAYYTAMYNMSDASDYHYDFVWQVEGKDVDEDTFLSACGELLRSADEVLAKTSLYDPDGAFESLEDRSLGVDEAIDLLYELLGEVRPALPQEEVFGRFAGNYVFASGAGGWSSSLTLNADGTFSGRYSDTTYLQTDEYEVEIDQCVFTGKFEHARRINGFTYAFDLAWIEYERTPGDRELTEINGTKALIRYTQAYGLDPGTKTVCAYTADAYRYVLPEKFLGWVEPLRSDRYSSTLDYNCLYSLESGYGWLGPKAEKE